MTILDHHRPALYLYEEQDGIGADFFQANLSSILLVLLALSRGLDYQLAVIKGSGHHRPSRRQSEDIKT
jgi:hypothetical protein